MLNTEIPMNNPNNPPQLATKSAIVNVSDRLIAVKYDCLNEIKILLVETLVCGNAENEFYSFDDQIQIEYCIYLMESLLSFFSSELSNGACDHSIS